MNEGQINSHRVSGKSFPFGFKLDPAWTMISAWAGIIIVLLLIMPRLLIPVYPFSSIVLGVYLYRRYPIHYVGFTWWIWFLGTFIRRLIDYRCGTITPWPYHFTPILVTSITVATLFRYLPRTYKRDGLPFALCFMAIFYGFFVGLLRQPISDYDREIIVLLNWLAPVCFGFHLFINWRKFPEYRQTFQQVFLWGVLIMGAYGIFQFLVAPAWDILFMVENEVFNGFSSYMGKPEPMGIRPWSTMGNPMNFAFNLMPGLILLLISTKNSRYAAAGFGYIVFLISRVRSSWYSWLIALIVFVLSLKERHQMRIILTFFFMLLLIVPLASIDQFSEIISSRFSSISNLEGDGSFQERMSTFEGAIDIAMTEFIGWGLVAPGQAPPSMGSDEGLFSVMDNGYLSILVSFGWFATICYVGGIVMMVVKLFSKNQLDPFTIAARAIAVGSLSRLATSDISTEAYAMPVWGFLGIAIAGYKYHLYQQKLALEEKVTIEHN